MESLDDIAEKQQVRVPKEGDPVALANKVRTKILETEEEIYLVGLGGASYKFIETTKKLYRSEDFESNFDVEIDMQDKEFEPEEDGDSPDTAVAFVGKINQVGEEA